MKEVTAAELASLDPKMGTVEDWEEELAFLAEHGLKIVRTTGG